MLDKEGVNEERSKGFVGANPDAFGATVTLYYCEQSRVELCEIYLRTRVVPALTRNRLACIRLQHFYNNTDK